MAIGGSSRFFVGPAPPVYTTREDDAFVFAHNNATNIAGGGGIAMLEGGSINSFSRGLFLKNKAPYGGAISVPRVNNNDGALSCVEVILEVALPFEGTRAIEIRTVPYTSMSGLGGSAITNKRTYHCLVSFRFCFVIVTGFSILFCLLCVYPC